jgi:2-oxoglutarate ferredoxin oxidoreductase subunit alpha
LDRLAHKFDTARNRVPSPVIQETAKSEVGIIAYGSSHWATLETLDQLKEEHDLDASYCRLRGFPFSHTVKDFIRRHERVYVVDQNRDAQMLHLLRLEVAPEDVKRLRSVRHYNGLPIDARSVTDSIVAQEGEK